MRKFELRQKRRDWVRGRGGGVGEGKREGKSIPGRGNSMCTSFEVEVERDESQASVAGAQNMRSRSYRVKQEVGRGQTRQPRRPW